MYPKRPHPLYNGAVSLGLVAALGGSLVADHALSTLTFGLSALGLGLIVMARLQGGRAAPPADREAKLIGFTMAFFALASLATWSLNGFGYEGYKGLGKHARLLLFWPLFVALTQARLRESTAFLALLACSVLAGGDALLQLLEPSPLSRAQGATNPIPYGNLSLLTGILLLVMTAYAHHTGRRAILGLALAGALLALSAAFLSQTRSNLTALLAMLLFLIIISSQRQRFILIAFGILLLAVFTGVESRIGEGLNALWKGQLDQGATLRFEIWQHSLSLFLEAPVTGVGSDQFAASVISGIESGKLPPGLRECCLDHAHNDLLQALAQRGLIGALAWLLVLAIPFTLFLRLVRHESARVAHLATAGALVPLAYLMFGLTTAPMERGIYITFYLVSITALTHLTWRALDDALYRHREQRVSATVITLNEADNIGDCLASLMPVADEIIVLDSGSTDDTIEIARRYTNRVEVTDWPGFGVQKQRALERATGDWVLSIDADERVSPYLAREINHVLSAKPAAQAYKLPWAVTVYGKRLDFGRSGRAPLRLFRREGVRFSDAMVHERILLPKRYTTATLRGRLIHYTHRDFGHALDKGAQYAWLGAREKFRRGKRTRTLLYPTLRGFLTFFHVYAVRLGLLDGSVGFLVASTYAQASFNKYAGLWTLTRQEKAQD